MTPAEKYLIEKFEEKTVAAVIAYWELMMLKEEEDGHIPANTKANQ